jgi:hypothetical protein
MNDQQILTIALASAPTTLTVLIGILLNNARMSDLNNRMAELRQHLIHGLTKSTCASMKRRSFGAASFTASKRSSMRA